jgi:hypothetical protein
MKNFNSESFESWLMVSLSLGLLISATLMLSNEHEEVYQWVCGIVIGINIPILGYWLKKLIDLDP